MGPEPASLISPLRSAYDRGIRCSIHLDMPVTPMSPLQAVWSAVNRVTRSGTVLGPDQRVSPAVALRTVTVDAAWQNFEEHCRGSIEPGKLADFTVLEDNPLAVDPMMIRDVKVARTTVGGRVVYDSEVGAGARHKLKLCAMRTRRRLNLREAYGTLRASAAPILERASLRRGAPSSLPPHLP